MAQSRVTEYFCTRKKSFDVIQPSKKLKLDVYGSELKSSVKSPDVVKLRAHIPTSAKRVPKRKQMTTTAGNIKSFLGSTALHKQSKLCVDVLTNDKTRSDAAIWQNGIKTEPKLNRPDNWDSNALTGVRGSFPEKIALDFCLNVETTPSLNCVAKQKSKSAVKSDIRSLLDTAASPNLSKPSLKEPLCSMNINHLFAPKQSSKSSMNISEENTLPKDKHALLREKITLFKAAARKTKIPESTIPESRPIPSSQQFHSLSQKDTSTSLVLPLKYSRLYEMFRATETIVSMLHNRKEVCTFEKLKQSVEQLTKLAFDREHLGQIASVLPHAYKFSLEKGLGGLNSPALKGSNMQLTVTPVVLSASGQTSHRLYPAALLERREKFYNNLVTMTKKHHESFLANLNPPILVNSIDIIRWHPKFPIDNVPDIPIIPLPKQAETKIVSAKDVLEKMNGIVCSSAEKVLERVVSVKSTESKPTPAKILSGPLKGLSQALLDKIRNKENAKIARQVLRKPESEKRLEMLNSLPEIARILRTYFVVEKRAAIALEDVKVKICDSFHSPISPDDVEQHLSLLCPIVPRWITYVTIPKGVFVKIDKSVEINDIVKAVNAEIVREKS